MKVEIGMSGENYKIVEKYGCKIAKLILFLLLR